MSTVVAVETPTGIAIAGDTQVVDGESVSSDQFQRVFDVRGVGVGVVGESGAVQQFRQWFDVALQDRGFEGDDTIDIDAVARIAARGERGASSTPWSARTTTTGGSEPSTDRLRRARTRQRGRSRYRERRRPRAAGGTRHGRGGKRSAHSGAETYWRQ